MRPLHRHRCWRAQATGGILVKGCHSGRSAPHSRPICLVSMACSGTWTRYFARPRTYSRSATDRSSHPRWSHLRGIAGQAGLASSTSGNACAHTSCRMLVTYQQTFSPGRRPAIRNRLSARSSAMCRSGAGARWEFAARNKQTPRTRLTTAACSPGGPVPLPRAIGDQSIFA